MRKDLWQASKKIIEGLSASTTNLSLFQLWKILLYMALLTFLDLITEDNISKILMYREIRVLNNPNTDSFRKTQWD